MSALLAMLATLAGLAWSQPTLKKEGKAYGIIFLTADGGKEWSQTVSSLRKGLAKDIPLADAVSLDAKALQKAADGLEAQKVQKIVVVPMFLSSYSGEMDELRYLLGIRKEPAKGYFGTSHRHESETIIKRVKFKAPVVLGAALDDHASFSDLLAERAKKKSKNPAKETLVIVAKAPAGDEKDSQWQGTINSLAEMARRKANMAEVRAVFLPQDAGQADRDKAAGEFKKLIRTLKRQGPVIVLPLTLTGADLLKDLSKALNGTFVQYDARPLLPDAKLTAWAQESAQKSSALPDMRNFKDEGRPMPKENQFHHLGDKR